MSKGKRHLEYHSRSSGIFFEFDRFVFKKKSPYQAIEVIENPYFGHVLFLDGLVQTTEKDEFFYHEMLAHPSLVAHSDPQQVLIIGGGDGGVLKEVLRYPIKKAKLVEIDAQVIEIARKYFPWLSSCLQDDRAEIITAEGKNFLQNSDEKYDVIIVDSSEPVGPSVLLHEENFYQLLKDRLTPEGIACTQVGSPFYQSELIIKAKSFFDRFFKVVSLYLAPVPTYPGGMWCFAFLSDAVDPLSVRRESPSGLKYYNLDIHRAAFALPNFLKKQIE